MTFPGISRRRFLLRTGGLVGATAVAHAIGDPALRPLARAIGWNGGGWLPAAYASPSVVLDTNDPLANFAR
jgi:hypothetical protein